MTEPSQDFDWEAVYERFGELPEADVEDLHSRVRVMLAWGVLPARGGSVGRYDADRDRRAGRRFLAMAWVICPELFGEKPSMQSVARSIGMHKAVFSELTAEFSRVFGVRNKAQRGHGWNHDPEKGMHVCPLCKQARPAAVKSKGNEDEKYRNN